jgi:hypothetical protein
MGFPTTGHRFLHTNLITEANATPSEIAAGRVTQGTKDVSVGGAAGRAGGIYTGLTEQQIWIEIDDTSAGVSIGQATYRVSYNGGTTWTASGQATASSPVTLPSGNGLTFVWTAAASGADCAVGDRWKFKAVLPHGMSAGLDLQDRNRTYRTTTVAGTKTIDIDLGTVQLVRGCFLLDHNLTSGATVTVKGGASSPAATFTQAITWSAGSMGVFFSQTYRYWRISILDAANTALYLEVGKFVLGDYLELTTRKLSHVPWGQAAQRFGYEAKSTRNYRRATIEAKCQHFPLNYGFISPAEYDTLVTMRDACWNLTSKLDTPLVFVPDSSVPATSYLTWLTNFDIIGKGPVGYGGQIMLDEVVIL